LSIGTSIDNGIKKLKSTKLGSAIFNPKPHKQSPFRTYGSTGTRFFSGFITDEEYLADLQGWKGIAVYDKMRRNDAQVHGTLYAIKLPIRQAKWYMEPASDSPQDKEIAERISKNLFKEMTITWDDFLRQALTYTDFGHSVFEKVFKLYDDGKILLQKLAPRLQKTIYRWYTDKNDSFSGIQQYVQSGDGGSFEYIDIWREKLVTFVNDQEGNNFEGLSVLRSAYKHWYIKDKLYKIDAIGHDRWASGIPYLIEGENTSNDDRKRAATVLENLHSRENSYANVPNGYEFGLFEKNSSNASIVKSIQHHNEEIAKNILAQFINLGTTSTGSNALGEAFEELFMQSLNAIADYTEERINRFVIRQLVDMNWGEDVEAPRLKHGRIMLNYGKWVEGLAKIGLSNAVTRDNEIEQVIRETAGLPLMSPETIAERDEMRKKQIESMGADNELPDNEKDDNGKDAKPADKKEVKKDPVEENKPKKNTDTLGDDTYQLSDKKRLRELSELEAMICDFDEVERCLDEGVDKFTKQVLKIKKQQAEFLSKEVLKKTADKIKVPYIEKLAERLYKEQKRQMNKGRRHLREEITRQKEIVKSLKAPETLEGDDFEDSEKVDQFLKDKSKSDSVAISNKTLGLALFGLYNLDPELTTDAQKSDAIFDTVMGTGNRDIANIADASINKAYSLGRETQAANTTGIEYAVYSSVLDGNTCERCIPKDGVQHQLNDERFQTPNPTCLGGDRCRCINIYVTKDMPIEGDLRTPTDWEKEDKAIQSGDKTVKGIVKERLK
jgi:hypothetical protein